jgi:hypothetical protein
MNEKTYEVSRSELYEQVWTVPMSKLAKRYGISDVGLAKICKRNNIPRPARGYWARKEAGYKVVKLPLPPGDDSIITVNPNPFSLIFSRGKDSALKVISSHDSNNERVVVPERLSNPHPLIKQSSELLKACEPSDFGLLEPPKKGCLDIVVSKNTLRRALRIMDTIIKSLEKRGHGVFLSESSTKTKILDVTVSFGINEKLTTKKKQPKDHDLGGYYKFGHSLFVEERVPSGNLCLTIHDEARYWSYGCQQNWNDGKKQRLEDRIGSFIEGLVNVAFATMEHIRQEEEEKRKRIEYEKKRRDERRRKAELKKRYHEEQQRVLNLISDAENWDKAKTIRAYIQEIERLASIGKLPLDLDRDVEEWLKWARAQADRLDPLTSSPPSILDKDIDEKDGSRDDLPPFPRW